MAKKSRVSGAVEAAVPAERGVFKAGIYARLSNEASGEDTLETQVYFLKEFVEGREDMVLAGTYSDFGFTGTNYERPGFLRLMEDVKRGKIDCIVVKDLSRLGRNYIETGNLIENVFSFLDIRLVAVTDGFDTGKGDGMGVMVASIKNLVNDVYSRDISRKIISAFRTKQRNGEFIGLAAPYGYLKSKENKNRLVVDEGAAPVVRRIFRLYADGASMDRIVRILDGDGIDCPRKYGLLDNGDYILLRKEFLGRKEKLGLERERLLRKREEGRRKAQGPAAEEQLREWLAAERLDRRMAECFVEAVRVFEGRRLEASLLGREEILRKMEG